MLIPHANTNARALGAPVPAGDAQARAELAQKVLSKHAKSFAWAARLLSPQARTDAALLYALARAADDWADEEHLGSRQARMAQLYLLRDHTLGIQATTQAAKQSVDIADVAIAEPIVLNDAGVVLRAHGVPTKVTHHFFDSLEADAQPRCLQSSAELLAFCYGVAGTVGLMMCPILGAPPEAQRSACLLGMAMQLTNIARDVVEDAARGRTYIPAQWGVDARTLAEPSTAAERTTAFAAITELLHMAEQLYALAQPGVTNIPRHNQRAIAVALSLYRGIGRKILRQGAGKYWQGRAIVSPLEKAWLALRATQQVRAYAPCSTAEQKLRDSMAQISGLPGFPAMHGLL